MRVPCLACRAHPNEAPMKHIIAIFVTVFLAELGDKTQLATLLFAAKQETRPLLIFLAAAGALITATALAVMLGTAAERTLAVIPLKLIAGLGFLAIGAWTIWGHFSA
jgi:putative Ca2+/H+ antiporter (TMEM165/GDT1 family)